MASTPIRHKKNSGANKPTRRLRRRGEAGTTARAATEQPMADEPMVGPTEEIPVDVGGAARILGTPKSWIYSKVESGEIPSYKIGHYRRFLPSELREYLRACRSGSMKTNNNDSVLVEKA